MGMERNQRNLPWNRKQFSPNSLCTLLGNMIPADLLSAFNEQSHRVFLQRLLLSPSMRHCGRAVGR